MDLGFDVERMLLWIVLLPLAGAVLNGLIGRYASRQAVGALGVGTVAAAFVLALLCFSTLLGAEGESPELVYHVYEWFSLTLGQTEVPVNVQFTMDPLSGVMTLIVTGIGLLIHIYSIGYMHDDPGYPRFFAYLNLFMASMLILVLASNLPLMFVGWEGVGLCSYLLIGYWWENTEYAKAGRKAFIANRIGDFGVLIGMFILVSATGSFEFDAINAAAPTLGRPLVLGSVTLSTVATAACLFLFLGCTGKSAQIPLYVWLPDAMAGPTPVSALIHAATMVTAGVYLCCRLSHVFMMAPAAMAVIAIIGALTALLAASIALAQNEMKKILAYSTVSQLGFMFAAVGVGAFSAGIFHVYTHAFFKACLFLGAGSVMHAVGAHGDADIRKLGGLRGILPRTHWTFAASTAAIAGFPLLSGFFSKDEILLGAATLGAGDFMGTPFFEFMDVQWVGWLVFGILAAAAIMTAFYMFRLYFLTFWGSYRSAAPAGEAEKKAEGEDEEAAEASEEAGAHDDHGHGYDPHPHESPPSMTVPLAVLGAGAIVAGWVNLEPLSFLGFHFNVWGEWLAGTLAAVEVEAHSAHAAAGVTGLLAFLAGSGVAYARYVHKKAVPPDQLAEGAPLVQRLALEKWRVDELYQLTIIRPIQRLALLAGQLDKYAVDGFFAGATSVAVRTGGWLLTRLQTGLISAYGAILVIGLAGMTWWFLYPHVDVETEVQGAQVRFTAARGLGYAYRWDAAGDGLYETTWVKSPSFTHSFSRAQFRAPVLLVEPPPVAGFGPTEPKEVHLDEGEVFDDWEGLLGPRWHGGRQDPRPPSVRREGNELIIRPNDARMRVPAETFEDDEVTLEYGQAAFLGGATVAVGAHVEAVVQVRNAFDNVRSRSYELVIQPAHEPRQRQAALEVRQ